MKNISKIVDVDKMNVHTMKLGRLLKKNLKQYPSRVEKEKRIDHNYVGKKMKLMKISQHMT